MIEEQARQQRPGYRRTRGGVTAAATEPATAASKPRRIRRFWTQVNNNLVALISLVLAITSLSYNTWRNETSEMQRNWRDASFQILTELGELNQIILMRRYFSNLDGTQGLSSDQVDSIPQPENWVRGWGSVTMMRDLSAVMPKPLPEQGQQLFDYWQRHAGALHDRSDPEAREQAAEILLGSIEELRVTVVNLISDLR